ncbi:MAG: dTMP kinase [Chloroflexota bacterium]|nr:dTMP kinase [Chloroflexota bacterium]
MLSDSRLIYELHSASGPAYRAGRAKLIVLEGIDLSGRTTQVQLLHDWLSEQHYPVTRTALRTSPLISAILARAQAGSPLQPLTYSLLFCADHLDRTQRVIKPALERGEIVLADRYTYTALARDAARGLDPAWVRNLYRFSVQPDIVLYLHISPDEAVKRRLALLQQRIALQHIQAESTSRHNRKHKGKKGGKERKRRKQDLAAAVSSQTALSSSQLPLLTPEALESFQSFEYSMYSEYQRMQKEFSFNVIDGKQSIEHVQTALRRALLPLL